jgi:ring-1,2-phenylacetyl-CoA epoxidase subunit PaaE
VRPDPGQLIEPDQIDSFFICGPGPMMDAAEERCGRSGCRQIASWSSASPPAVPSAAIAAQMQQLQDQAAGLSMT